MSVVIDCQSIEKSFGPRKLFQELSFGIFEGERLGIIGNNGSGKSTLLKILAGQEVPDSGDIVKRTHLRVHYIPQTDSYDSDKTIRETLVESPYAKLLQDIEWEIARVTSQHGIDDLDAKVGDLSGGMRKRLSIIEALLVEPDVLLLDEPTNHLDIDNVLWLEGLLKRARFTWVVISHDRQFLENTVSKVAELSPRYPKGIYFSEGGYEKFLENRDSYIAEQQSRAASLANKMNIEDEWLKRGPKARTTKAKSRIERAENLRTELSELKQSLRTQKNVFDFSSSGRKTKKLVEMTDAAFSYDDTHIFGPWNVTLHNGLRLGLLGKNGSGKTTLMKLFTKKLEPASGSVKHADKLSCVYFDQKREQVDESKTLKYALADDGNQVVYRDKPVHVVSWAKKFLFRPEQLDTEVHKLSGGEKAKIILSRLMLQHADVLALDEPTNDLDIDSLETLEESLNGFQGAVIIISHDRYFLESVCNWFLGFDQNGDLQIYQDVNHWHKEAQPVVKTKKAEASKKNTKTSSSSKKLSYKEQREYDAMEDKITKLESELESAQANLEDPAIASNALKLSEAASLCETLQSDLDAQYARWAELEAKMS